MYQSSWRWTATLTALCALGMLVTLYLIFFFAPEEQQMGIVQKIFYFHVPSAYAMYIGFILCAVSSVMYLWNRKAKWDALALAGAEVGLLFCAMVLLSGPLWARKAWGVWWTWDPRLTTTLLAGMVFAAYLALRGSEHAAEPEKRFAAALAIFGVADLPLIHYSVLKWRGVHPIVIRAEGGGLDSRMLVALLASLAVFTLFVSLMLWMRYRLEQQRQELRELKMERQIRGAKN